MIEVDDTKAAAAAAAATEGEPTAAQAGAARTDAGAEAATQKRGATSPSYFQPLLLQPNVAAAGDFAKDSYHVEELLRYHDRHFVQNIHRAILGRAPSDAESAQTLDDLRGGRASKTELVERLLESPEARSSARRVRVEGLPSPFARRAASMPVVGYLFRLARALMRLPLLMEHQRQFETYALGQQQRIADHINQLFALGALPNTGAAATGDAPPPLLFQSQNADVIETVLMFSDTLLDLSNSHAELQAQTEQQAKQADAALTDLTAAIRAQQEITETIRREQEKTAQAQQEFLIQEQRVIVETQRVVLEELREELRAFDAKHERARAELEAALRRLESLVGAARPTPEDSSGQA